VSESDMRVLKLTTKDADTWSKIGEHEIYVSERRMVAGRCPRVRHELVATRPPQLPRPSPGPRGPPITGGTRPSEGWPG
jgi:hypothetical protein